MSAPAIRCSTLFLLLLDTGHALAAAARYTRRQTLEDIARVSAGSAAAIAATSTAKPAYAAAGAATAAQQQQYIQLNVDIDKRTSFEILQPFGKKPASKEGEEEEEDDDGSSIGGGDRQGTYLWPASTDLAKFLLSPEGADVVRGRRVVELGAGTGIAGLAAAAAGASAVTLTDGSREVLGVTRDTVDRNMKQVARRRTWRGPAAELAVERLRWSNAKDIARLTASGSCDIVLGAEITYLSDSLDPLFSTMRELMLTSSYLANGKPTSAFAYRVPPLGLLTYTPELAAFDGRTDTEDTGAAAKKKGSQRYPKGEEALALAARAHGMRVFSLPPPESNPEPDTELIAIVLTGAAVPSTATTAMVTGV